ncbi:MAG: hypothetical protein ACKVOR_07250 [Flavobacteriales bacterium]
MNRPFMRNMYKIVTLLFFTLALSCSSILHAQGEEQPETITREEALKKSEARLKAQDEKMEEGRKEHLARQDKATQQRMKKNKRRSERYARGKEAPFFKRWFQKKKF